MPIRDRLNRAAAAVPRRPRLSFVRNTDTDPRDAAGAPVFHLDSIPEEERSPALGLTREEIDRLHPGADVMQIDWNWQ